MHWILTLWTSYQTKLFLHTMFVWSGRNHSYSHRLRWFLFCHSVRWCFANKTEIVNSAVWKRFESSHNVDQYSDTALLIMIDWRSFIAQTDKTPMNSRTYFVIEKPHIKNTWLNYQEFDVSQLVGEIFCYAGLFLLTVPCQNLFFIFSTSNTFISNSWNSPASRSEAHRLVLESFHSFCCVFLSVFRWFTHKTNVEEVNSVLICIKHHDDSFAGENRCEPDDAIIICFVLFYVCCLTLWIISNWYFCLQSVIWSGIVHKSRGKKEQNDKFSEIDLFFSLVCDNLNFKFW